MSESNIHVFGHLELRGGGGEEVDLARTLASHGVASLAPNQVDHERLTLTTTIAVNAQVARTVVVAREPGARLSLAAVDGPVAGTEAEHLRLCARYMLRLDQDLGPFYAMAAADPELSWVVMGAGRMLRGQSVFEDTVKTICTTNCSWAATERMVAGLVARLGATDAQGRRAFPTPTAMAQVGDDFYRTEVRAGYRGRYLRELAERVAGGGLDLEALNDAELSDEDLERRLLDLPGVGPYAAAHIMLTSLGRCGPLVLDSWTLPTWSQLSGREPTRAAIEARFNGFGAFRGLAFWLYLTRSWVPG